MEEDEYNDIINILPLVEGVMVDYHWLTDSNEYSKSSLLLAFSIIKKYTAFS
jgi:hypothetical protein